jgi:tetratricopeptide (TPR) repeat protein
MIMPTLLAWTTLQASAAPAERRPAPEAREEGRSAEAFIARGLVLYRRLRFQEARREFQQAVEADPSSAAAHFYLGYTLYKIGEPTRRLTPEKVEAREEFARCFELDRSFRPIW